MVRFSYAFLAIFLVIVIHVFALSFDAYRAVPWFDIPMHFFGGYAMAMLGLAVFHWIQERVEIRPRGSVRGNALARLMLEGVFVVGFALLIGIAWEWYEFLCDQFATALVHKYGYAQMGLSDTMDDFLNDGVGAVVAWNLWRNRE
jgi:hypothetical protein